MSNNSYRRPKMPNAGPNGLVILLLLIGGAVLYLYQSQRVYVEVDTLTYSSFIEHVEKGHVKDVTVVNGTDVHGVYADDYRPKRQFEATIEKSELLWQTLRDHHVDVDIRYQDKNPMGNLMIMLFFLLLLGLAFYYLRNVQSGGNGKIFSMSKSHARQFAPNSITIKFKDVAGVVEAKEDLSDIIDFLRHPSKFERLGAKIPRGILLCGAPGNGKTLLAKAVAGEASCAFFSISGSDFVEVFVGVGASRVRDLFAQARKSAPCIVFIDEIDAVGRKRGVGNGGGNDEREQTLNQLLAEMDGFSTERGAVIVLAATNRPDVLDKALLRPGRFDRTIEVPYPDMKSREQILGVHSRKVPLAAEVNLHQIARGTPGFSGADLENLVNEAALLATKDGSNAVGVQHFEKARDKIILGAERKTMIQTEDDKRLTAYHEGGHTLLNLLLPQTDPFQRVTIVPRGRALGVSMSLPERDTYNKTKEALLQRVQVCLGGFLAEKLVFDQLTTGASNDIEKATEIARAMVCTYGMSRLGPIQFRGGSDQYLGYASGGGEYSPDTARRIDEEIEYIMGQCYKNAEGLLAANRDKLDLLATSLLEKETLEADEVYALLGITPRIYHSFTPLDTHDDKPVKKNGGRRKSATTKNTPDDKNEEKKEPASTPSGAGE